MDYVHFASFENVSDPASNRTSNPCRYSSAVVEQLTCNQQVPSSTLGGGTITFNDLRQGAVSISEKGRKLFFLLFYSAEIDNFSLVWSAVIALYHQLRLVTRQRLLVTLEVVHALRSLGCSPRSKPCNFNATFLRLNAVINNHGARI